MMRVTHNTGFDQLRNTIQSSKGKMEKLQYQASTLKKLNTPSDNPVGAAKVLEVRTEKVNTGQFIENAKMAEAFLNNTDHALAELGDIVVRAKEIALGQSSGASSNDQTRIGIAEEITNLYNQAIMAANRRIGDRYLFGGYKTDRSPVTTEGRYVGDRGEMMVEVAKDIFLTINIPGIDAFNTSPQNSLDRKYIDGLSNVDRTLAADESFAEYNPQEVTNINVFDELQNLRIALLTGDIEGIRGTLERFDHLHGSIVATRAKIGSRIQGLASTHQALERHHITQSLLTQNLEDADMSKVVSDLANEETVLRTVLTGGQKLVQPTLMDFLK